MRRFENSRCLMLRHDGISAVAFCGEYADGTRRELAIRIYRDGHAAESNDVCVNGGHMSAAACSPSIFMLQELLHAAFEKWRGVTIDFDCPDERRARIYAAMLQRHGINFKRYGSFFELER